MSNPLTSSDEENDDRLLKELQQRSRAVGPHARTLKSVLKNWQIKRNLNSEMTSLMTLETWAQVVGQTLADYTRPGHIKRGALEVFVDSPLVMQELTIQKTQILQELQHRLPDHGIKSLRFKTK